MSADLRWLTGTAVAAAAATLGAIGLLSHIDETRGLSIISFDVLWMLGALAAGNVCWRHTRWGRRE